MGCTLQRTSGMGTGLVVSPVLVLLVGPVDGVVLTNITTVASAALLTATLRHDIEWRRYRRLAPFLVIGAVPAALLVASTGLAWLEIIIGSAVLGTLLLAGVSAGRTTRQVPLAGPVAGVAGGFLNTAVGVGGPALLLYAQVTNWAQRPFAATLQPLFLTMGVLSVATKAAVGAVAVPGLGIILLVLASVVAGVLVGGVVARRVAASTARRVAAVVVLGGGLTTLVRGIVRLTIGA